MSLNRPQRGGENLPRRPEKKLQEEAPVAPKASYSAQMECENCRFRVVEEIPKGTRLQDVLVKQCPNCGCLALKPAKPAATIDAYS